MLTDPLGPHGLAADGDGAHLSWRVQAVAWLLAIVAAGLLAALVLLVHRATDERDRALARTEQSFAVVLAASRVQAGMARAEAALGRFVTDSDRRTGMLYYDEWRHAGERLEDLRTLVRDDSDQAAHVDRLVELYGTRGRELALPAARAGDRQGWNALGLFYKVSRSPTLPEIARLLDQVIDAEQARLGERASAAAARTDHSNGLTRLLSIVGMLLAVTVAGLVWCMIRLFAERRVARELADSEGDRAAHLGHAVALRTMELRSVNLRLQEEAATREQAEEKLRQIQKMEVVGQLTGGIAHDFNNMLAVVLGGIEMARRRVDGHSAEAKQHLDNALEGAQRAAALTRRLLAFARAQPLLPAAADPGGLLRGMSDLLERTIGERVEVRILTDIDVWPVWIDSYQLENAVLNLAVNARDAMGGFGTLTMSAANMRVGAGDRGSLAPGDYVRIAVSDSGQGMPPQILARVFEPFFTTKPVGQGTGLGLSQTLGFARQSGGDVVITSHVGEGTTVAILLPRHQGEAVRAIPAALPEPQASGAGLPVLLVEDDPRVREATSAALEELGYLVTCCSSGAEALAQLEDQRVGMVMTDVIMPGMTGIELAREVRRRWPVLPVLFVTGYAGDGAEEGLRDGVVLRKPFTLRALSQAIVDALETRTDRAA